MNRFFQPSWYRGSKSHKRKSAFGGTVASMDEVNELNEKIIKKETAEFEKFEADFDEKLKKL
jgi:hypothetical protein